MAKAWFVLLIFALIGICAPPLATAVPCAEEDGADSCDTDCAQCLCCSHAPRAALNIVGGRHAGDGSGHVGVWEGRIPQTPLPREILHVPRPDFSR